MLQRFLRRHPNLAACLFGCGLLLLLWGVVEGVSYLILQEREARGIQITKDEWQEDHATLGYRPKASFSGNERKWRGDSTVYDVTYTFDSLHRRITPAAGSPDQFALFFGDSFTFGQGVEDNETLPAQFAALAPEFRPYNYGCGGYGPQNMWMQVHRPGFMEEVTETSGIAVYTFIRPQVFRAIGSLRLLSLWGKRLPCLQPEPQGLVFRGLYEEVFPWRCRAASLVMSSPTLRLLNVDWPRGATTDGHAFVAQILAESAAALRKNFPGIRFVVLLYPTDRDISDFRASLKTQGLSCLDYTTLFQGAQSPEPLALGDGHPTPAGYRIVAEALVKDLQKFSPPDPSDPSDRSDSPK